MKKTGHPKYLKSTVKCGCGNTFETRSTRGDLHVDICAACHPFYTGKQRTLDIGGRVDRFNRRFAMAQAPK
ncbi:MAG: 50S ribosomal protein L31 [Deltaproteobacteria bacterium]|nr:50S ribosomal protein L31 [Deltaproteobacteria bacterium]